MSSDGDTDALRITFEFKYGQRRCRIQLFDKLAGWQLSPPNKTTVVETAAYRENLQQCQHDASKYAAAYTHLRLEPIETDAFTILPFSYIVSCSLAYTKQLVGGSVTPPSPRPRDVVIHWAKRLGNRLVLRVTRFGCECHRRKHEMEENPSDDECQCETFCSLLRAQLELLQRPTSAHFFVSCCESSKAIFNKIEPYFKLVNASVETHDLEWTISSFSETRYGVYKCGSLAGLIRQAPTSTCVVIGSRQQQKRFVSGLLHAHCFHNSISLCPSDLVAKTVGLSCTCKLALIPPTNSDAQVTAALRVLLGHVLMTDVSAAFEIRQQEQENSTYNSMFLDWGFMITYGPLSKYFVRTEYKFVSNKERHVVSYMKKRIAKSQFLISSKNRSRLSREMKLFYKQAKEPDSNGLNSERSRRPSTSSKKQLFTARRSASIVAFMNRDSRWKSSHFDGFQLACYTNSHWLPTSSDDANVKTLNRSLNLMAMQNHTIQGDSKDRMKVLHFRGREFCIGFAEHIDAYRDYFSSATSQDALAVDDSDSYNQGATSSELQVFTLDDDMPTSSSDGSPDSSKKSVMRRSSASLQAFTKSKPEKPASSSQITTPSKGEHAAIIGSRRKSKQLALGNGSRDATDDDDDGCESQQDISINSTQRFMKLGGLKAKFNKLVSGNFLPNRREKLTSKKPQREAESPVTTYDNEAASEETTPRAPDQVETFVEETPKHRALGSRNSDKNGSSQDVAAFATKSQSNFDMFSAAGSTQRRASQVSLQLSTNDERMLTWAVDDRVFTQIGTAQIQAIHMVLCPGILVMYEGASFFHNYS